MRDEDRYGGNREGSGRDGSRKGRRDPGTQPRGGRFDGPGRRTYGAESNPPRVGRPAAGVPKSEYVRADASDRPARQDASRAPGAGSYRGSGLHRGTAWRSESGPRGRRPGDDPERTAPLPGDDPISEFVGAADDGRLLAGRNPIREALKAGRPVEKLLVASGDLSGAAREIVGMARDAGAVVQQVDRSRLDQVCPGHQGMLAYVAAVPYASLEDILAAARARNEDPFLILLDGVTDPHNLGAIIRSAECAGAHGVVVPERRAAGLTPAAAKAAAGALDHLPVARVKNLNRAIEALQAENIWVVGTAMDGEDAFAADLTGPVALVIGSEGDGVSRLTLEKCDRTVSLPMKGHIESLNASVAAGILMYEIVRQRTK